MTDKRTTRMYSSMYGIYAVPGYINVCIGVCIGESSTREITNQVLSKPMFSIRN